MTRTYLSVVVVLLTLSLASRTWGQEKPDRPLALALEPVSKTVKAGTTPAFRLTVRNRGKADERILDVRPRRDLQDTYCDLEVTRDGRPVELPRAISDPGVITDDSYLVLKPGEQVLIELSKFPTAFDRLPPGRYKARVRFWQDPFKQPDPRDYSPYADFAVEK